MEFLKKKVLKFLRAMKDVGIGLLRPATIPQVTAEVVGIGLLIPDAHHLVITDDIIVVMLIEVDPGHKILATLTIETS